MPNTEPVPQGLPLIAYAEHLCKGARVLVSGQASVQLAEALLARGARIVHVFEKDALRRAEAEARTVSRQITFSAPDPGMREGFFDLVLIENLALEGGDPAVVVRGLAKLLAPRGAALIAAPNPEAPTQLFGAKPARALDYYSLYDAVAAAFPTVRMLGQVPFVGCALIDFSAEGEPAPVFDTSLLPPRGEEPETFVALGSREPKPLESYVVVQLPSASLQRASEALPSRVPASAPPSEPPAPAVAVPAPSPEPQPRKSAREEELEAQLARQEAWIEELEKRSTAADERADAAESEIDELRERYSNLEQVTARERAAAVADLAASHAEVERLRRRANDLSDLVELKDSEIRSLQADLAALKAELEPLKAELEPLKAEFEPLKAELEPLKTELAMLKSSPSPADEIAKLENQLKEQGHVIRALERDLREAERTGRELVRKLTQERHRPVARGIAERLVEAEAELVSLRWSLQLLGRGKPATGAAPGSLP